MRRTPFPACPAEVVPLSAQEFAIDLDTTDAPSLDAVCGRFTDDANRALVWLVRFQALQALRGRAGMAEWLRSAPRAARDVCEVAARFTLNDCWEFDEAAFCSAVDAAAAKRSGR